MKILLVEDDFISRKLMNKMLLAYGEVDQASLGEEAIEAFKSALIENKPYELVCLDIMMPGINGLEVLKEIRKIEEENGISGLKGAKIFMVTALSGVDTIKTAFNNQCEAYLIKPIVRERLELEMKKLGVI